MDGELFATGDPIQEFEKAFLGIGKIDRFHEFVQEKPGRGPPESG
jgi:hypothetical protein